MLGLFPKHKLLVRGEITTKTQRKQDHNTISQFKYDIGSRIPLGCVFAGIKPATTVYVAFQFRIDIIFSQEKLLKSQYHLVKKMKKCLVCLCVLVPLCFFSDKDRGQDSYA